MFARRFLHQSTPTIAVILLCVASVPFVKSQNPYCKLTCDDNQTHTVCKRGSLKCAPGPKCGTDFKTIKMTNADREHVLNVHNQLRNRIAAGGERRNRQPRAANMNVLNYDKELEFVVQCWLNECNGLEHDACRRTQRFEDVGQNLARRRSTLPKFDYAKTMSELIAIWYDEVIHYHSRNLDVPTKSLPTVLHYTQLVWANTTHVGCAAVQYVTVTGNKRWHTYSFGCNYGHGGNYIGVPLYEKGVPCSRCGKDSNRNSKTVGNSMSGERSCNAKYRSLCGRSVSVAESTKRFVPLFRI